MKYFPENMYNIAVSASKNNVKLCDSILHKQLYYIINVEQKS